MEHPIPVAASAGTHPEPPELWFERLEVDRYRSFRPTATAPQRDDAWHNRFGAIADRLVMQPVSAIPIAASLPVVLRSVVDPRTVADRIRFYAQPEFLAEPYTFFEAPPSIVPARSPARSVTFRPSDGRAWDLVFASPFEPVNPALRGTYLRHQTNRFAHARYFRHANGPRPTVVCVHGWVGSQFPLNVEVFNTRWLYERGLDVLLVILPYHGPRRLWVSGYGFPNCDLARTAEAFAHAAYDIRVFTNWLREQGVPSLGMTGVSLGGYMTALMAALDPNLDFAVPIMPATSFADIVLDMPSTAPTLRMFMQRLGWSTDDVRRYTAVHTPLQHEPLLPPEQLMIICGCADKVAPPYQSRLLWEHWGGPELHWFAGSHLMHARRDVYLRALGRFLGGLGLLSRKESQAAAIR